MTTSEAIDVLEMFLAFSFEDADVKQMCDSAVQTAISALQRMSPKRPLWEQNHRKLGYVFVCPHCRRMSNTFSLHCKYCGQKIEWSEEVS